MFVALSENLSQDSPEEHSQWQRETEIWETYWRNWGSQLEKTSALILDYPKARRSGSLGCPTSKCLWEEQIALGGF